MENWFYCVKAFCDGASQTENLCVAYKMRARAWAEKRFDKCVESMCYEKVTLVLQNAVYIADTDLVLKEYHADRKTV